MNPPESNPNSLNPLSWIKSTLNFMDEPPPIMVPVIWAARPNDNLEDFHVSQVKSSNPEFSLSVEEIALIREFPKISADFEEIDANYLAILKSIGEDDSGG